MDFGELLKQATALKRQGDLDLAVVSIDQAIDLCPVGDTGRVQAVRKRIGYLLQVSRHAEALESAEGLVSEAQGQAAGMQFLVGACYSVAYQERAKVRSAMGEAREALRDYVRAIWWWQSAMRLQDREKEHTPKRAADRLAEHAQDLSIVLPRTQVVDCTERGLALSTPEAMVELF